MHDVSEQPWTALLQYAGGQMVRASIGSERASIGSEMSEPDSVTTQNFVFFKFNFK
jgi:hypothetical protein